MLKQIVFAAIGTTLIGFAGLANAADTVLIVISHEVANFGDWKKRFDAVTPAREKTGIKARYVMRDVNKPNAVIVVLEAGSVESAKRYVGDPAFLERVKKASSTGSADIKVGTTNPAAQ